MATPMRRFLSNEDDVNALTNNATSCDDCSIGCCCCLRPPYCMPSPSVTLDESIFMAPPNLFNQEHHTSYEYKEPEENFVSIDDVKIKKFLTRIGQQRQTFHEHSATQNQFKKSRNAKKTTIFSIENEDSSMRPVVYEIIELDDEEERKKLKRIKQQAEKDSSQKMPDPNHAIRQTKRLDISLIPKYSHGGSQVEEDRSTSENLMRPTQPRIVAEIDLVDSSSNDSSIVQTDNECLLEELHQDDEESLPPVASVQCELLCDDNSDEFNKSRPICKKDKRIKKSGRKKSLESDCPPERAQGNVSIRWKEHNNRKERVLYECFICGKRVQSSYNLRRHMMIHTGEKPFNCDICNRKFREFSDLKKHRRRHAGDVKFLCMVCGKYPPADSDPTRCVNCCAQTKSAVIVAASIARQSQASATTIPRQNEKCSKVMSNIGKTSSIPHTRSKFSETESDKITKSTVVVEQEKRLSKIESSETNESQASQRAQHLLNNLPIVHRPDFNHLGSATRKEFPCPLCSRVFGSRHNLKRHYMIHTGEKPFSCPECRKPFREYSTLKKHMVTHQRDRWYKCGRCSRKYRDFLKYSEHKNSHPPEIEDTSKISPSNGGRFVNDSKYDDSSCDDWLECCECAQSFTTVESYNNHIKQHNLNERSYECYICKEQFNDADDLQTHKERHNHEPGFS